MVVKKMGPMARTDLGDIEHLVLLAILRLGKDAYGIPILDEVSGRSGREVSRATVYVALKGQALLQAETGRPQGIA
jgi:hypothetical protein